MKRALLFTVAFISATTAHAQQRSAADWKVTLTATLNPLPAGLCGALSLSVLDASGRDVPRNPLGYRTSIADFDLTLESRANAAVLQRIDEFHWSVCGCPDVAPGSEARITAVYPARSLSAEARVPHIESRASTVVTLAPAKGRDRPRNCAQSAQNVAEPFVSTPLAATPTAIPMSPAPAADPFTTRAAPVGRPDYAPGPAAVVVSLSGQGYWYEPSPAAVSVSLSGHGTWYEAGPAEISIDLSGTGNWIEGRSSPVQMPPPNPRSPQ